MMIRRCHSSGVLLSKLCEFTRQQHVTAARSAASERTDSKLSRFAGIALFSTIAASTAALGVWQTKRYYWKRQLIRDRELQMTANISDLPENAIQSDEIDELEFHQLRMEGEWKPKSTFYLYPRSSPAEATDSIASPKPGGYIYSLLLRENGTPVIVNRGWLPHQLLEKHIKCSHKENGEHAAISGFLRKGGKKGKFTPDNDFASRHMYWLDHHALAQAMGVKNMLPVMIDASRNDDECEDEITLDFPLRKTPSNYLTFYMTPEKHAGYAVTWFSFSIASIVMGFLRFRRTNVRRMMLKNPL